MRRLLFAFGTVAVLRAAAFVETSLDGEWNFQRGESGASVRVTVPHDWAISGPFDVAAFPNTGKLPWRGKGEYRRTFGLSAEAARELAGGGAAYLEFDGVLSRPRVRVNGREAGGWDYGYVSFRLDVTRLLRAGENEVEVACDTMRQDSRWYPGGGLFRSVRLVVLPRDHVVPDSVFITTPAVSDARAVVHVAYERVVSGPTNRVFVVERPRLWNVDDPQLYSLELDGRTYRYGIREFKFTGDNGFILNGRRVQLKGVNLHSDLGPLGVAFSRDAVKRQLLLMKGMGVNALRTSHNAPAPQVLDLCDELGIVVWNECFDKWDRTAGILETENLEQYVARNLRAWVRRDRNHPSVFVWSVGNEIPAATRDYPQGVTRARCAFFRSVVRELDRTRPVGIGCCHPDTAESGALDDFDITGWNYARRYEAMKRRWPDKPILYTESASALSGYGEYTLPPTPHRMCYDTDRLEVDSYDRCSAPWSDIPDVEFNRMGKDRFVGGEFVWTGIDYLGEPTPYAPIFKNYNGWFKGISIPTNRLARSSYFGAADLCGIPKDRWYLYRSYWNQAAETVHIVPDGWNFEGRKTVPVYVYTSGDEAELFLNGKSLGRRHKRPVAEYGTAFAGETPPDAAAGREGSYYDICDRYRLRWPDVRYEPGRLEVVAYRKGERIGSSVVRTAGRPVAVKLTRDPYEPDGSELAFVQVDVVDAAGTRDPHAATWISFYVEGPGRLLAVGNGNARGLDSFVAARHPLYNGKALAIVKLNRKVGGRVVLHASAEGLASASMIVSENLTTEETVSRRCSWFDDAALGMFIHWGLYSVPARGEWVMYRENIPPEKYNRLADEFRQDARFSPEEWVRLAVRMGAKYAVLTTRHHDGFCLWDTKTTDFNSVKTAAGRDYVREFADACRRHGLKVGFYLSTKNWQFPTNGKGGFDPNVWERMVADTHAALTELMTQYGKVDLLWHDGCQIPGETDVAKTVRMWRADELNARARRLQPEILINDRAHCDFDFVTPEQTLAGPPRGIRWESCMTVNGSWGYTAGDEKWKSGEELVRALLQCQRFGGRMLLNIGPRADGSVPDACRKSLECLGDYIARCPDSFRCPLRDAYTEATHEAGPVVRSGNAYYLHTFGRDPLLDGARKVERIGENIYRIWRDDADCPVGWLGGRHDLEVKAGDAPVLGDVTSRFTPPSGELVRTTASVVTLPTAGDWKVEMGFVNGEGFKDTETVRTFVAGPSQVNLAVDGAKGYYAVRATPDWRVIDPRRWSVAGVFLGKFVVTHDAEDAYAVLDRDMPAFAKTVEFVPVVAANAENDRGNERVYAFPSATVRNFGFMLARTVVSSPEARTVTAAFASDYWGDVYVNGRRVVLDASKPSRVPQFNGVKPVRFDLKLESGDNEILVMNHGGTGPQWFVFYVNDSLPGPETAYVPIKRVRAY